MGKSHLFFFSLALAVLIAYVKRPTIREISKIPASGTEKWKTFEKQSADKIVGHPSTDTELTKGHVGRKIASDDKQKNELFSMREDRILTGEDFEKYKDESIDLPMMNKINPAWKDILGNNLLRFQKDETKILIKEELHLIKIIEGQGLYLEQVAVTFLLNNGDRNSFRALINSETGEIVDSWDRTLHEQYRKRPHKLVPSGPSNIIGR